MLEKVVFSDRAIIALLAETQEHLSTETGGVFLGHRCGDIWYIIETMDPGPNSVFQPAYFEYDDVYLNHLMNKVDRLYQKSLDIIGLWHRHPGSFDQFSGTDDGTNIKYARRDPGGAISALVNIDPSFRLTIYHVTDPLSYRKIKYEVGDKLIPSKFLTYTNRKSYLDRINHPSLTSKKGWFKRLIKSKTNDKERKEGFFDEEYIAKKFTFSNIIHEYLSEEETQKAFEVAYISPIKLTDEELNILLEMFQEDLDYFEDTGINVMLSISEAGALELKDNSTHNSSAPITIQLYIVNGDAYLNYNKKTYRYVQGMLKEACEFYSILGDENK